MSRYGGFRINRILTNWQNLKSTSAPTATVAPVTIQQIDYSKTQGIWNLKSTTQFPKSRGQFVPGLAGKFFNGTWRGASIAAGNIGSLPLTTTNDSSNVTGTVGLPSADHRYGVNLWTSIAYGDATGIGAGYGFIAIGYFNPLVSGTYNFYTSSDDYSGVWIGDIASASTGRTSTNAIVNNGLSGTAGQGNTRVNGSIVLTAGISYPIRIVHEDGTGGDNLTFGWSGPSIAESTNLASYFTTPAINNVLIGNFI